jgi:hypothetical protein
VHCPERHRLRLQRIRAACRALPNVSGRLYCESWHRIRGETGGSHDDVGRPNTALLVIDLQNGVVEGSHNRDDTIANINTLIGKARAEGVPVVWVQHSDEELVPGSEKWAYVPELVRRDSEFLSTSATATRSRTLTSRRCSPSAG